MGKRVEQKSPTALRNGPPEGPKIDKKHNKSTFGNDIGTQHRKCLNKNVPLDLEKHGFRYRGVAKITKSQGHQKITKKFAKSTPKVT